MRYGCIVADPPWHFRNYSAKGEAKNPVAHYACMSTQDIAALPVHQLAAPDCALLMWATAPMLPDAIWLMKEWGLAAHRAEMLDRWSHKNEGTPETLEHASNREQSSIARMFMAGDINQDQLAWAEEIGVAAEMIERDVQVKISSYIPRIDCSAGSRDVLVEGILAVRREIAYTRWRGMIPDPKRAILDMLVGEPKSFSAVAKMYRMHKRRAKALLIRAIDIWPDAMSFAEKEADAASLAAAHAGLI